MQTKASTPTTEKAAPASPAPEAPRKPVELPISKRKQPWLLYLIILLAAGGFAYWKYFVPKNVAEVTPVFRGNAAAAVYGSVTVEPTSIVIVRPQMPGTLSNFKLEKGDIVKKDQVLAEIDDPDVANKLSSAQITLRREEKLLEVGPNSLSARDQRKELVAQLKVLMEQDNIPRAEYEKNLAEYKTLESKVTTEQLDLEGNVEKARTELRLAQNADKKRLVKAPMDGVVLDVFSEIGEVANPRSNLFTVGSHTMQCRVGVNEEDVGDLKEGLECDVQLYSYPSKTFKGKIKRIIPLAVNQEYNVIVELKKPPEGLMPGMTGEANIGLAGRDDVLVIPTRAVRGSMRSPFVRVVNKNGVVENKKIKIGYRSVELCEITKGLEEGEQVIITDQDLFNPGDKVQTKLIPASTFQETDDL